MLVHGNFNLKYEGTRYPTGSLFTVRDIDAPELIASGAVSEWKPKKKEEPVAAVETLSGGIPTAPIQKSKRAGRPKAD